MPLFPDYSLDELIARARNHIRLRARNADVGYGSDYDFFARMIGTVSFGMQQQADALRAALDSRKSFGQLLREYAGIDGVGATLVETSVGPVAARGKVILLSASASQTQLAGSTLQHADGTTYTLDTNATTSATATKTLRVGNRSGRRRIIQGHAGAGFVSAVVGEVYQFAPTNEYCAIRGVDNASSTQQHLFDLHNDLDDDPLTQDTFVQKFGAVANITATVAGESGDHDSKDLLFLTTPAGDIQAVAYIVQLDGGRDELTPSQMQGAIRDLHGKRQGCMSLEDIRQLALGYEPVPLREAVVSPGYYGPGSYVLYAVGANVGAYITSADNAAIAAFVGGQLSPADHVNVIAVTEVDANLATVEVRVDRTFAPDWSMLGGGTTPIVCNAGSTTTRVQVTSTSDMAIGDRVIIATSSASIAPFHSYIVQRTITGLSAGAYFDVDEPLPYPPDNSNTVITPGGPLGQAIIDAIYAHYDAQVPSGSAARVIHPPATSSTSSEGVRKNVAEVPGVLDVAYYGGAAPTLADYAVLCAGVIQIKMWA